MPQLSAHYAARKPSVVRIAQIKYAGRTDGTRAVNTAIGNVSRPMHPAMHARLKALGGADTPFADGVVPYTATVGLAETNRAFLNVIAASGFATDGLHAQVTDGGSLAMELVIVGLCGPAGSRERPLLLIDAAYTNYQSFADRVGRATVSVTRRLGEDGRFSLPPLEEIERAIETHRPAAVLVIPYDNPTGQLYTRAQLVDLARLCVKHDLWLVSDEAYRELCYDGSAPISVWALTEDEVPGITGRRVSIETASKVWNACGLRIGALVTDSPELHAQAVAENTAGLCSNHIGQWIFGALAHESHADLSRWFDAQRRYYHGLLAAFTDRVRELVPGAIVSSPEAAIYSVVDVRNVAGPGFDALDFVLWCATEGKVDVDGEAWTLLTAPMAGFYTMPPGVPNPGRTQMRLAYVPPPREMAMVPDLLAGLFHAYEAQRG